MIEARRRHQPAHRLARAAATLFIAVTLATAGLVLNGAGSAAAAASASSAALNGYESDLLVRANAARATAGAPVLRARPGLTDLARTWAVSLASRKALDHNQALGDQLLVRGGGGWSTASENVGKGGSSSLVLASYRASAEHSRNLLRAGTDEVGIGAALGSDGAVYNVMVFVDSYDKAYGPGRTTPQSLDAAGGVAAPPGAAPPVTAPPVSEPPVAAPPVSKPPVAAPPVSKPPVATAPSRAGAVTGLAGKCLDIRGGGTADGTAAQLYRCNGTDAQRWTPTAARTLTALGGCLDVTGGSHSDGAAVQLYGCNGTTAQQWVTGGSGSLRNPASGKCLDVPRASTADGTQLILWTCNGGANQRWKLAA